MLEINTFSAHDLVAFCLLAALAILFYLSYWLLGRGKLDLLFANLLAAASAACLLMFLEDNLVPQGTQARDVPGAAGRALWLMRAVHVISILAMPMFVHFVLRYTNRQGALLRNIRWVYAFFLALMPMVFLPSYLTPLREPLSATSDWLHAIPWMPWTGPLICVWLAVWTLVQVFTQVVLYRYIRQRRGRPADGTCRRAKLVRLAFLVQAGGGVFDASAAALGYYAIAGFPVTAIIMSALIAITIVRDRIDSERSQQRLAHELDLASRIQAGLLPKASMCACGFELAGWNQQAAQVGGDLYDFVCMPDGRWMILLADASGHGMGPALEVAETRAALRAIALRGPGDPAQVLQAANSMLAEEAQEGAFVTCFLGFLDPLKRKMQYASAGHGPIVFYDRRLDAFATFPATAMPLGILSGADFTPDVLERDFSPGDFMVVVSDGILEAIDDHGDQFGIDRLMNALRDHMAGNPSSIVAGLRSALAGFTKREQHTDDLTMVFLRDRLDGRLSAA